MSENILKLMHKRFTTWTDETLWSEAAVNSGLVYGVYDHHKEDKHFIDGWIATTREEAQQKADELNLQLEDPFVW